MLGDYVMRRSLERDKEQLRILFKKSFGDMAEQCGALDWVDGRYMLTLKEDIIISCTGILPLTKSDFNGYEVTWTCTLKEYRHQGFIVSMLAACEKELQEDKPIYCSCWHLPNKEKANLHNALTQLGYKEVIHTHVSRMYPHTGECIGCCYKGDGCYCTGDLYYKVR